jgi:hypothetical protein
VAWQASRMSPSVGPFGLALLVSGVKNAISGILWTRRKCLFSPDIIVTGEDTPQILLPPEAKLSRPTGKSDETRLKTGMVQIRCPIGHLNELGEIAFLHSSRTKIGARGEVGFPRNLNAPTHGYIHLSFHLYA